MQKTAFLDYVTSVNLETLFKRLNAPDPVALAKTVEHFTTKEAEKRDKMVLSYFGTEGINRIVENITRSLLSPPTLQKSSRILDIGAGSGFFTTRIFEQTKRKVPTVVFYAMDATPAMLLTLERKKPTIKLFIGIAENIQASIKEANSYIEIPDAFDAVFSTLMLHHSPFPEKVFESISKVLKSTGKAVILDLCEHKFTEFKTELSDLHMGFSIQNIRDMAKTHFERVDVHKIQGIECTSSGRSAEMFIATMQKKRQVA